MVEYSEGGCRGLSVERVLGSEGGGIGASTVVALDEPDIGGYDGTVTCIGGLGRAGPKGAAGRLEVLGRGAD